MLISILHRGLSPVWQVLGRSSLHIKTSTRLRPPHSPRVPHYKTAYAVSPGTVVWYPRLQNKNDLPRPKNQTRPTRPVYSLSNLSLRVESTQSSQSSRSGYTPRVRVSRVHACTRRTRSRRVGAARVATIGSGAD